MTPYLVTYITSLMVLVASSQGRDLLDPAIGRAPHRVSTRSDSTSPQRDSSAATAANTSRLCNQFHARLWLHFCATMARPSVAVRNLSLTEELEKLEQSITLTLQGNRTHA